MHPAPQQEGTGCLESPGCRHPSSCRRGVPAEVDGGPQLKTSLAFYRGKVKVFETPAVTRASIDAPDRKAALFQFEIPPNSLTPGLYTCQINIIDEAAAKFVFPRVAFYVR